MDARGTQEKLPHHGIVAPVWMCSLVMNYHQGMKSLGKESLILKFSHLAEINVLCNLNPSFLQWEQQGFSDVMASLLTALLQGSFISIPLAFNLPLRLFNFCSVLSSLLFLKISTTSRAQMV